MIVKALQMLNHHKSLEQWHFDQLILLTALQTRKNLVGCSSWAQHCIALTSVRLLQFNRAVYMHMRLVVLDAGRIVQLLTMTCMRTHESVLQPGESHCVWSRGVVLAPLE